MHKWIFYIDEIAALALLTRNDITMFYLLHRNDIIVLRRISATYFDGIGASKTRRAEFLRQERTWAYVTEQKSPLDKVLRCRYAVKKSKKNAPLYKKCV